jgi:hypothetical protein
LNSIPTIQAGIISLKDITIEAEDTPLTVFKPIKLLGPVVSLGEINFNRDLGTYNANYPPQSVLGYDGFLYELTKMERDHITGKSFTGLGIYDIQWDYEN